MTVRRPPFAHLLVPVLAVLGLGVMAYTVIAGDKNYPAAPPLSAPAQSPYPHTVAGAALVEASSENIAVGSAVAGTVAQVTARVGEPLKAGAPLFVLDARSIQAEVASREAALATAQARAPEARAQAEDAAFQLSLVQGLDDNRAVSREEVQRRRSALAVARARQAASEAAVQEARAQLNAARTELARHTVRAPIDGEVLQVNVRPGEYLATVGGQRPAVVMGDTRILHVRVDVDENDAWRVRPGARATVSRRGNAKLKTEARWVRAEPLVTPKKSLTGDSVERVDTRVLQLLFAFERKALPVYVGQQMDVFIEAAPLDGSRP